MTYMKLVTVGVKHHLTVVDQSSAEFITLCGCAVTQPHHWKRIGGLEGDECEHCAELAFGGTADHREAKQNPPTEQQISTVLQQELIGATARASEASELFLTILAEVPSGLPYTDDKQRIQNASSELAAARKEMMEANSRLSDFLLYGMIPEDFNRTGLET